MSDPRQPHHTDVRPYLFVFGTLMVLTLVTVLVSYLHFPPLIAITAGLAIATLKASLVAVFFMHLKGERILIYGLLGLTVVFAIVLFTMPITDSRQLSGKMVNTPVEAQPESR